jgi:hypothetical protein
MTWCYFLSEDCYLKVAIFVSGVGGHSDERTSLKSVVQSLNGLGSAKYVTLLYCLIWDSPNLEGQNQYKTGYTNQTQHEPSAGIKTTVYNSIYMRLWTHTQVYVGYSVYIIRVLSKYKPTLDRNTVRRKSCKINDRTVYRFLKWEIKWRCTGCFKKRFTMRFEILLCGECYENYPSFNILSDG